MCRPELGPQLVVGVARGASGRLPLLHEVAVRARGLVPIGGVLQGLGAHDQFLLGALGGGAVAVQLGEVGAAATVERVAGARVALPQLVVRLVVDAANGAPLFEDGADAIARGLPLIGVFGELLRLRGERFLPGDGVGAALRLRLLGLLAGDVRCRDDRVQARVQGVQVADDRLLVQRRLQCLGPLAKLRGVVRVGCQAGFDQLDLGDQVVEALAVVRQAFLRRPCLPGADLALRATARDKDRAVLIDATKLGGVSGGHRRRLRRDGGRGGSLRVCGTRHGTGLGRAVRHRGR